MEKREMTNAELLRYIQSFDEDFSFSDYTTEELFELLESYKMRDDFKEKYFEFYDDVKCETRKRQDW